jgi:anaerobic ribonucleoside-triphosphate reductase activating protein
MKPQDVMKLVNEVRSQIEGVTFTGGEPFEQAFCLSQLAVLLQEEGLSVMSFTGYTLEELLAMEDDSVLRLLSSLDILVDGRYIREQAAPLLWRGSANQRICLLTSRYKDFLREAQEQTIQLEAEVGAAEVTLTGNIQLNVFSLLKDMLKRDYGIILGGKQEVL